jgi:hypothetical protein
VTAVRLASGIVVMCMWGRNWCAAPPLLAVALCAATAGTQPWFTRNWIKTVYRYRRTTACVRF